ncbi:uncharacterized protein LOC130728678 [Lotus japonicus]|uniref:uncharacterized protein LOC130728678 n=1 Tax=Lotus japonicus TaxID=34305 RepID=UPI00258B3E9A|nr:uncharacterized protein LOC130728678 [Lotus japonicus]
MEVLRRIHVDTLKFQPWGSGVVDQVPVAVQGGDYVMLDTDGSWSQGLNGMGGDGVICDSLGRWVFGFTMAAGAGNAFKSEIAAVHKRLLQVWDLGFRQVRCYVDCSELQQVLTDDRYVHNYWHGEEITQVRYVLARNWNVTVAHVTRDRNVTVAHASEDWKAWRFPPSTMLKWRSRS